MDVAEHFTNLGLNSNRRPNLQPGTNAIPSQQGVNAAGGMGQEDVASGAERQDATRASTAQEVPAAATTGQGQQQSNLGTTTAGDADLGMQGMRLHSQVDLECRVLSTIYLVSVI